MGRTKFALAFLIVALIVGMGASAFWAGHASSGSSSLEVKTYQPGWATVPWLDDTMPIDGALSSIAGSVGAVYYLDPDTGGWKRYIPGRAEVSNLTTMTFGQSYLMLFTKPVMLELVTQPEDVCPAGECTPCPTPTQCPTPTPCPDSELVISPDAAVEALVLAGATIWAHDGQYLGQLSCNTFASDSILNEFGKYGSPFSSTSIWNEFGQYGSEFSSKSAFSELTATPPAIYVDDSLKAYLTINPMNSPAIHPYEIPAYCWKKHP